MGRISGWKKTSEDTWENESYNVGISLDYFEAMKKWYVHIDYFRIKRRTRRVLFESNIKQKALAYAMQYMRSHPNG